MPLYIGGTAASKVYVGGTLASAVYLGSTKVWASFTPGTTTFSTVGTSTYTIPAGAQYLDIIVCSGGEAGTNGTLGNGQGGKAGVFNGGTFILGGSGNVNRIPLTTTTLSVVVGAGGASNGADGAKSSVTGTGLYWGFLFSGTWYPGEPSPSIFDAMGGAGGMGVVNVAGGTSTGSTVSGINYAGGAGGVTLGTAGAAPGGGGAGGGFGGAGGKGGDGRVWIRAY
jgi:hypothetical protein